MVLADLIVFQKGATTRSSGWTFYNAQPGDIALTPKPSAPELAQNTQSIIGAIHTTSKRHGGNRALTKAHLSRLQWRDLFQALIEAESNYRPTARSPKGAYGLGQLMPATARALSVDPHNMAQNLDGAARYLLTQLARFQTVDLALAAYNAGPHRVTKYSGVPPFSETRTYIKRINRIRARLSGHHQLNPPQNPDHQRTSPIRIAQETRQKWPALVLKLN